MSQFEENNEWRQSPVSQVGKRSSGLHLSATNGEMGTYPITESQIGHDQRSSHS